MWSSCHQEINSDPILLQYQFHVLIAIPSFSVKVASWLLIIRIASSYCWILRIKVETFSGVSYFLVYECVFVTIKTRFFITFWKCANLEKEKNVFLKKASGAAEETQYWNYTNVIKLYFSQTAAGDQASIYLRASTFGLEEGWLVIRTY